MKRFSFIAALFLFTLPALAQAGPPLQPDLAITDATGKPIPPPYLKGQNVFIRVGLTNTRAASVPDQTLSSNVTTTAVIGNGPASATTSVPLATSKGINNDITGAAVTVPFPACLGPNGTAVNFSFMNGAAVYAPPVSPGGGRVSGLFPATFLTDWPAQPVPAP